MLLVKNISGFLKYVRRYGLNYTIKYATEILVNDLLRKHIRPLILEFYELGLEQDVVNILHYYFKNNTLEDPTSIKKEYEELATKLQMTHNYAKLKYPEDFKIEDKTAFLLYSLVRLYKPNVVVETGVANGHSTFYILSALNKNAKGKLYSIDISKDVGSLVSEELKERWELIILEKPLEKNLEKFLAKIAPFDLFVHDSNHMYFWQALEYKLAYKYIIKNGGFIMTDDADYSYAFLDFCKAHKLAPVFLFDSRKIFGIVKI